MGSSVGAIVLATAIVCCCALATRRAAVRARAVTAKSDQLSELSEIKTEPWSGFPGVHQARSSPSSQYLGNRTSLATRQATGDSPTGQRMASAASPFTGASGAINEVEWSRFELIRWNRVVLHDFIGSGTTGDVYRAEYASTEVACKLLRKRQVSEREMQVPRRPWAPPFAAPPSPSAALPAGPDSRHRASPPPPARSSSSTSRSSCSSSATPTYCS